MRRGSAAGKGCAKGGMGPSHPTQVVIGWGEEGWDEEMGWDEEGWDEETCRRDRPSASRMLEVLRRSGGLIGLSCRADALRKMCCFEGSGK